MAIFDPVSITRAIEATPFPQAPNVVVAYPQFEDWKKLYRPGPLRMPDAQGIYRNVDAFESRYRDMKRDHEKHVLKCLGMIKERAAGRAVLAELKAQPSFSVCILPFDFLPRGDWEVKTGALAEPIALPQSALERFLRIKPFGTKDCQNGACWADLESQSGKSVDVFYTARRFPDSDADGALLHELVHATRLMAGVFRYSGADEGYTNNEEFYASIIENIYRSEKRLPVHDYHYHPITAASFLKRNVMASFLLSELRVAQQALFLALASVDVAFNPIKQFEDERQKLIDDYAAAHPG